MSGCPVLLYNTTHFMMVSRISLDEYEYAIAFFLQTGGKTILGNFTQLTASLKHK